MARLPSTGPSFVRHVRQLERQMVRQRDADPSSGSTTGLTSAGQTYVDNGDATTLTSANNYTDNSSARYGLEAPYAALTIPANTVTAVLWGTPTENTGSYVVSSNTITVPSGMGGVYAVTATLSVAALQSTRSFVNLYIGSGRMALREVFTGDNIVTVSGTARAADLDIIKAEIVCGAATSLNGGWITLYRLHS